VETAYILAFCLLLSCLVVRFNPLKAFAPGLVLVVAFAAISIYLFIGQRVYVRIIPLFAAAGISYACITLYEIGRTRKIFSQFVPKVMAERILNTRISLRKVEATIMFADLRGYTAMSEKYDPMDVAALVNGYHAILDRVAMKHGGMTVGNRGDGKIMLFGEDENDTTHAQRAIRAAMEMNNELEAYADGYDKKGWGRISVGLGISTGVVALGFIGGKDYQEFGPQGDAANTAARLQGLSKELGFNVIIGPTTYEKAKYDIVMQPLKKVKVKGKADEIEVYRYVEDTTRS
jgi:adenylate cyclase